MKDKLNSDIESVKSNLEILPKKTKQNIAKCNEYIEEEENKYRAILNQVIDEINGRVNNIKNKFNIKDNYFKENILDFDYIKSVSEYTSNMEKMNLNLYFYELSHFYNDDMDHVNDTIRKIITSFKNCGVNLTQDDFITSSSVNTYMGAILSNKGDLNKLFEELYWKNSNITLQIQINFRYLYFKYKKVIDKYYSSKLMDNKYKNYISNYIKINKENESVKHNDINYLYSLFMNKELSTVDYSDKNMEGTLNTLLIEQNDDTYNNLLNLNDTIKIYNRYSKYEFIINDIKELYKSHDSYKGEYDNKLKEISKKEKELFGINKKLNKTSGLFKTKDSKLGELRLKSNLVIEEIIKLYQELDNITIHDIIFKYINNESSYLDILKVVCFDYGYLSKLYFKDNEDMKVEDILKNMNDLQELLYGNDLSIISGININEERNIPEVIRDRYRLINIMVNEDNIGSGIEDFILLIKKVLEYFDIKRLNLDLNELDYIFKVEKLEINKGK